jgi:hypothetical protein
MIETKTNSETMDTNAHLQMPLWSIGISYVQMCFSYCHEPDIDLELNQWKHTRHKQNQQQNKSTMVEHYVIVC